MVSLFFDRTDSGSVATVLLGDAIVVRVADGPEDQRWMVEESGYLTLETTERVESGGSAPGERLLRFRASNVGETMLRLALRAHGARVLDQWVLVIDVHAEQPLSSRGLLRKKG
jgi:hypothetical protein